MKKALIFGLISISAFALSACNKLYPQGSNQNQNGSSNQQSTDDSSGQSGAQSGQQPPVGGVTVKVKDSGFEPATITIGAGQSVTFVNESSSAIFVASNPHPTHTDLPEFQSKNIEVGKSYSFTFTQLGSWGYHDHLNPTHRGTVVVN